MKREIFSLSTKDNIELGLSLYRAVKNRLNTTIIYFHGGGLIFGVREDLPGVYLEKFLTSGYDFLAIDYPLAPESRLDTILESTYQTLIYFLENHKSLFGLASDSFILFGRSAGAYLSLMMCNKLIVNNNISPQALISLYGYARLDEIEFNTPSRFYNNFPLISEESIESIASNKLVTRAPVNLRYPLYIKARQEGNWVKKLLGVEYPEHYSLDEEALSKFPPTFLAAATMDSDVPYRASKNISKIIPNSHLVTIYSDLHDFDRIIDNPSGGLVYDEMIEWLRKI